MSEREPLDLPTDIVVLLDEVRRAPPPPDDVKARVRARLDDTLGGPSGDGGPSNGGPGGSAPSGGGLGGGLSRVGGWLGTLGATCVAVSLGVGGVLMAELDEAAVEPMATVDDPKPLRPLEIPRAPKAAASEVPSAVLSGAAESPAGLEPQEPRERSPASSARGRALAPKRSADAPNDTLAEEHAALEVARAALAGRQAAKALAALSSHRERFPRGVLSEEREALTVLALEVAGRRAEADEAARAFLSRFPNSLHAPAVYAILP